MRTAGSSFRGERVWVTGASSGIGLAFCDLLHRRGARLVVSARSARELEAVADRWEGAERIAFDMSDLAAVRDAVDRVAREVGPVDTLVNNAGVTQRALAEDTDIAVYEQILAIDLLGPIALSQHVLPQMLERGSGRLIAISSIAGKFGFPLRTGYCAAKHGLFGYFDALRSEVAHRGIGVHVVAPGAVRTSLSRNALRGNGATYAKDDPALEAGMSPDALVALALREVEAGRSEIVVARGAERTAHLLRRFLPERSFRMMSAMAPALIERYRGLDRA